MLVYITKLDGEIFLVFTHDLDENFLYKAYGEVFFETRTQL